MKQVDVNDAGHKNNGLQTWFLKSLFYDSLALLDLLLILIHLL